MSRVALIYLQIGVALSAILELSYLWADAYIVWHAGFAAAFNAALATGAAPHWGAVFRTFLWLPELLSWVFLPSGYSFGMWLAPGFYIDIGPMPQISN